MSLEILFLFYFPFTKKKVKRKCKKIQHAAFSVFKIKYQDKLGYFINNAKAYK